MRYAADFRSVARAKLSGRWTTAVLAGLVASLLGGVASSGVEISLITKNGDTNLNFESAAQQVYSSGTGWNEQLPGFVIGVASVIIVVALVMAAVYLVLGSIVGVGYSKFNLDLVDHQKEPEIGTLFGNFKHWKTIIAANLLKGLYIFLWSLLFILPGILALLSYSMTSYILAEHPELTASEALRQSKQMMTGNRRRLFWLQLSFFGWEILSALTLGIGSLWLTPYKQAATAVFYREVSGTRVRIPYGEDSNNVPQGEFSE